MGESLDSAAESLLSSLWFQLCIAFLVLLVTLAPQLRTHFNNAARESSSDQDVLTELMPEPTKPTVKKGKKGKKDNKQAAKSPADAASKEAIDKQLREIKEQQEQLRRVQLETQRLKQAAEEEAKATREQARIEAEQLTRSVIEQLNVKQQMEDVAAVRRAAEAEATALRQAAEAEAARMRKSAEEEAQALKKKAVEDRKLDMEQQVAAAAAAARDKMANEVALLRERAEAEVNELKKRVSQEAAAMFQQAEKKSKQAQSSNKPPKIPGHSAAKISIPPRDHQDSPRSVTSTPIDTPTEKINQLPQPVTPPKSPVVGSERRSPHASPNLNPSAHSSPNLNQPEASSSVLVSPSSSSSCSSTTLSEQHWKRQQHQQKPPHMQQVTPEWTKGWAHPGQLQQPNVNAQPPQQQQQLQQQAKGYGVVPDMTQLVPYKMKLCTKFMQTGHCKRGAGCTYAHGEHEIGMARPAQLQGVTLGEMNQRKRGKNMVDVNHSVAAYKEDPNNQRYPFNSVNASQFYKDRQMNPHQASFHPQQQMEFVPNMHQHNNTQEVPGYDAVNANMRQKANNGPVKSQWDKPPKIHPSRLDTALPNSSGPSPRHARPTHDAHGLRASNDGLRTSAGKEPSPFLPLSPSLGDDEPWAKDGDGRAAMSWADSAATPTGPPKSPPWKDSGSTNN